MSFAPALQSRRPAIVLGALLSSCLVLLSLQVRRAGGQTVAEGWLLEVSAVFVRVVVGVRMVAEDLSQWGATRGRLLSENRMLRGRITLLEGEILTLNQAERDRTTLLELFGRHPTPPPRTQPARLIEVRTAGPFQSALLDGGTAEGLEVGGVVVGVHGLVGRIVATGKHDSRVQLLSDGTAAVGVVLARTGRAAVAQGDGGRGLAVKYVPKLNIGDVLVDDVLVTAGTDGVYPKDLPVGRILEVRRGESDPLFLDLPVALAADPRRESLVFVFPPVQLPEARLPQVSPRRETVRPSP